MPKTEAIMFTHSQLVHLHLLVEDRMTKVLRTLPSQELTSEAVEYGQLSAIEFLLRHEMNKNAE
jgi:hypothetical protein